MSFIPGAVNHTLLGRISSELRDFYERNLREVQHLEEGAEYNPFAHLDKSTVLQECKVFHDANFVKLHPKRCCHQIVKLLYFYVQGETFSSHESLDVCIIILCPDVGPQYFAYSKTFCLSNSQIHSHYTAPIASPMPLF